MIDNSKYSETRKILNENMIKVLDVERYMSVMSPEELRDFELIATGSKKLDFSPETIERWNKTLQYNEDSLNAKIKAINGKPKKICKQKIVKK